MDGPGRHVHSVRRGKIQVDFGNCLLHGLWGRDVFCSSRGLSKLGMHCLSVKLLLACEERSFEKLHLQCGLLSRSSNRDVLWQLSVPTVSRHKFWYNLSWVDVRK